MATHGNGLWFIVKLFLLFITVQFTGINGVNASPVRRGPLDQVVRFIVKQSANPAEWTSKVKFAQMLRTGPNQALFWSGRLPNLQSVEATAQEFAQKNNMVTLEMALVRGGAVMPKFDTRSPEAVELWTAASQAFAKGANGKVSAFLAASRRVGNVYESEEKPSLIANANVEQLSEISAEDPTKSVVAHTRLPKKPSVPREFFEDAEFELSKRASTVAKAKVAAPVKKVPVAAPKPLVKTPLNQAPPKVAIPKTASTLPKAPKVASGTLPKTPKVAPGTLPKTTGKNPATTSTRPLTKQPTAGQTVALPPGCETFIDRC